MYRIEVVHIVVVRSKVAETAIPFDWIHSSHLWLAIYLRIYIHLSGIAIPFVLYTLLFRTSTVIHSRMHPLRPLFKNLFKKIHVCMFLYEHLLCYMKGTSLCGLSVDFFVLSCYDDTLAKGWYPFKTACIDVSSGKENISKLPLQHMHRMHN